MDDRLKLLLTPVPMSDAEKELRQWIKENKEILLDRTPDEVAQMAILCGFDRGVVYSTLSTFQDALNNTHFDKRMMMHWIAWDGALADVRRLKDEQSRVKELDLMPLWKDLHAYQTGETV